MNPHRVPPGTPTGGQFTARTHSESDVDLGADYVDANTAHFVVEHEHEGNIFEFVGTAAQCSARQDELRAQGISSTVTALEEPMTPREFDALAAQRAARRAVEVARFEFDRLTMNTIRDLILARHPHAAYLDLAAMHSDTTPRYRVRGVADAEGNLIDTQWDNGRDDTLDMLVADLDQSPDGYLVQSFPDSPQLDLTRKF